MHVHVIDVFAMKAINLAYTNIPMRRHSPIVYRLYYIHQTYALISPAAY